MPLTAKGEKIKAAMEKTYGSEKKAEQVLYASKNAGRISGIDKAIALRDCMRDVAGSLAALDAALKALC